MSFKTSIFNFVNRAWSLNTSRSSKIRTFCTQQKILVDNISINYARTESSSTSKSHNENKRAVLLMPGALGSALTDFKPQLENLPKLLQNYSIIAWDPPGYGKSIPPNRKFTVDFFNKDAEIANRLMNQLGFKKYSIMGWSDGGITGMILAANWPTAVEKLIFWGSNSYILPEELQIYEGIRNVQKWSPKMRAPMEEMYGADRFAQLWSEWVDIFGEIMIKKNGNICSDSLFKITASTLIVHGAKDPMISAEHVPFLRKNINNTEYYEFKDGKHNIHLRYAEEFNKVVAEFLQR